MRRRLDLGAPTADGDARVWTARVALGADDLATTARLHLGGIAAPGEVRVNGTPVWSARSLWDSAEVDVTARLRPGENRVEVRTRPWDLDAAPRRPRARWRTWLADDARLRWARTSLLGHAPGFAPDEVFAGPYRPVVLETAEPVRIDALRLLPRVDGADGILEVEVAARGTDRLEVVAGPVVAPVPLVDGHGSARVVLPDVTLWWPHTHGRPHLYDVRIRAGGVPLPLPLPGDHTTDPTVRRVGFRTVENRSPDSLDLHVNGVRIFCRGAVWTPGDLAALDTAAELGLNLVRVPGIGSYESDAFHARCAERGLLVWQDLMFSTFDYPLSDEEFAAGVRREVAEQAARLVGRPATVVVCGSAEHEQQPAMMGLAPDNGSGDLAALTAPIVAASGLDAIWVPGSPSGGWPPFRVDTGVAQYFGVGGCRRPVSDVRHARVRFAAECLAFSHLPDRVPEDGGDGRLGVPRDVGADWDFADVRDHYLRERYGPHATRTQAQRVTGEVAADVFGEWRRPDSGCGGGIVLWLRDLAPGAGWGLLDHGGRAKPAAAALAPVLQPTAVWFVDEGVNGVDVHAAHDPAGDLVAELRVELRREDGAVVESAALPVVVPGRGHLRWSVEELIGRFVDVSRAYRFGPATFAAAHATLVGEDGDPVARATWRPSYE